MVQMETLVRVGATAAGVVGSGYLVPTLNSFTKDSRLSALVMVLGGSMLAAKSEGVVRSVAVGVAVGGAITLVAPFLTGLFQK